VMNIDCELSEH